MRSHHNETFPGFPAPRIDAARRRRAEPERRASFTPTKMKTDLLHEGMPRNGSPKRIPISFAFSAFRIIPRKIGRTKTWNPDAKGGKSSSGSGIF